MACRWHTLGGPRFVRGALERLISMYWAGGEEPQVLGELRTLPANLCTTLINTHTLTQTNKLHHAIYMS